MTSSRRDRDGVGWRERSRLVRVARLWRTRTPRTFRDKVRYKMLRDHRPLVVTLADKAAARDYVTETVGARYLPQVHAIVDDPKALRALSLPRAYVVKPTHGSGAAIVVSDHAAPDARLPAEPGSWVYRHVRPEAAPPEAMASTARRPNSVIDATPSASNTLGHRAVRSTRCPAPFRGRHHDEDTVRVTISRSSAVPYPGQRLAGRACGGSDDAADANARATLECTVARRPGCVPIDDATDRSVG